MKWESAAAVLWCTDSDANRLRLTSLQAWVVEQGRPDLVYVSGRVRPPGEINGKSGNLNNVLSQLYPPGTIIPLEEVRCRPSVACNSLSDQTADSQQAGSGPC